MPASWVLCLLCATFGEFKHGITRGPSLKGHPKTSCFILANDYLALTSNLKRLLIISLRSFWLCSSYSLDHTHSRFMSGFCFSSFHWALLAQAWYPVAPASRKSDNKHTVVVFHDVKFLFADDIKIFHLLKLNKVSAVVRETWRDLVPPRWRTSPSTRFPMKVFLVLYHASDG